MINIVTLALCFCILVAVGALCKRLQNQRLQVNCQQGITAACHLLGLMKLIQQHRGVSSAVLGGKSALDQQLQLLSGQIDAALQRPDCGHMLSDQPAWDRIKLKWQSLKSSWKNSDVVVNFEQHCDLLRDLQAMMEDLTDDYGVTTSRYKGQRALATEIFCRLPPVIENLGQLRALSTHAAVRHCCITAFRLHLQYLTEQLSGQNKKLRQSEGHRSLVKQIDDVLLLIDREILHAESIRINPDELFRSVTAVMDNCYRDIEAGVGRLNRA